MELLLIAEETKNTWGGFLFFDILIFVVAVGCLVYSYIGLKRIKEGKQSSQWTKTTAELSKVLYNPTVGKDYSEDMPYQGLYTYKVNGKKYKYSPSNCYGVENGVPKEVEVIYNINNPSKVYRGNPKEYLFPIIVGVSLMALFVFLTYNVIVHGLPNS